MNRFMNRHKDAPKDWICNAKQSHGESNYCYDLNGHISKLDCPCRCSACLIKENPTWREGEPVQVHPAEEWTVEILKSKGYVGIYQGGGNGEGDNAEGSGI